MERVTTFLFDLVELDFDAHLRKHMFKFMIQRSPATPTSNLEDNTRISIVVIGIDADSWKYRIVCLE